MDKRSNKNDRQLDKMGSTGLTVLTCYFLLRGQAPVSFPVELFLDGEPVHFPDGPAIIALNSDRERYVVDLQLVSGS
jgi:hypothetical protein